MRGTSFGRWLLLVPMVAVVAVMGGTGGVVPEMSRAHAGGPVAAAEPAAVSPNFVVVVTDDQRWDSIGRCSPTYDPFDYTSGFSENGSRCPSSLSPDRAGLGMTRSTRFSIRSPNGSSPDAMRSSAWAALRREPT